MPNQHVYVNGERYTVPRGLFPDRSNHPDADEDRCREISPQGHQCTRRLGHAGGHVVGTGTGGGFLKELWRPGVWMNGYANRTSRHVRRDRISINGMLQRINEDAGVWEDFTDSSNRNFSRTRQCEEYAPGTVLVMCSRRAGHEGNHAYGDGSGIRAVWRFHMRPGERAPFQAEVADSAVDTDRSRSSASLADWELELANGDEPLVSAISPQWLTAGIYPHQEPVPPVSLSGEDLESWLRAERARRLRMPRARRQLCERRDNVRRHERMEAEQREARQAAIRAQEWQQLSRLP